MGPALTQARVKPIVIDYDDPEFSGPGERLGDIEYEEFLAEGDPGFAWSLPQDEWDAIALNYTSGTTGDPKGVVYHHRGAYLLAMGNVVTGGLGRHPVYLWTLPMFHCNGWCFPWTISIMAGTHVCLRQVRAKAMYDALADHGVTHLCGAPIVMSTLLNAPADERRPHAPAPLGTRRGRARLLPRTARGCGAPDRQLQEPRRCRPRLPGRAPRPREAVAPVESLRGARSRRRVL